MRTAAFALFLALAAGCGPSSSDDTVGRTLVVSPPVADIEVALPGEATAAFTAVLRDADGSETDVTADTTFGVTPVSLARFDGAIATARGTSAGRGAVTATYGDLSGDAELVVRVRGARLGDGVPPEAPGWFDGATDDPALAPSIVYPSDGTVVPPNLGELDVHFGDTAGNDVHQVTLDSEFVHLQVYVLATAPEAKFAVFSPDEWSLAAGADADLTATVRGLSSSAPTTVGTSAPVTIQATEEDVQGGIYYWASTGATGDIPTGVYRHDMGSPGEPAELFYTEDQAGRCVGCHALSRDGRHMALTYDGGNGEGGVLDVATKTPAGAGQFWNFASFLPDGNSFIAVERGTLTVRAASDASLLATLDTGGYASHPDVAPAGDQIAYVEVGAATADWVFSGGALVVRSFDQATSTLGPPTTVVPAGAGNLYYPSFSPDGQWLLYNQSTGDSYDDADAELWVVRADGSAPPMRLIEPNATAGLTNSWPRWAPFGQTYLGEPIFWLTFSSKRAFGVRLAAGHPQVWMAPFRPARADAGDVASSPAFRLPFQDIGTHNHIAQWAEQIVGPE